MTVQAVEQEQQQPGWRQDWPVAVVAAAVAALAWVVVTQLASVELVVGEQRVNVVSVVVATLVAAVAGAGLLRVLEARTANGVTLWTWIALGVLVVSMVGPLGASGSEAVAGLAVLHLLVGAVVIVGLRRRHAGRVA